MKSSLVIASSFCERGFIVELSVSVVPPSSVSKCVFHSFILSSSFGALNLALLEALRPVISLIISRLQMIVC